MKDVVNVRTRQFGINHCILTAVAPLCRNNFIMTTVLVNSAVSTRDSSVCSYGMSAAPLEGESTCDAAAA